MRNSKDRLNTLILIMSYATNAKLLEYYEYVKKFIYNCHLDECNVKLIVELKVQFTLVSWLFSTLTLEGRAICILIKSGTKIVF